MKKNGFIASSLLYSMLALFLILMLSTISILGNNKLSMDRLKEEALDYSGVSSQNTYYIDNDMNSWQIGSDASYSSRFTITYNASSKISEVVVAGASGWELLYVPINTVNGKNYKFSFSYQILANYTPLSGYSGIGYQATTNINNSNLSSYQRATSYLPVSRTVSIANASLSFTATTSVTYLVFNFGMANDGATARVSLGNFKVEEV